MQKTTNKKHFIIRNQDTQPKENYANEELPIENKHHKQACSICFVLVCEKHAFMCLVVFVKAAFSSPSRDWTATAASPDPPSAGF